MPGDTLGNPPEYLSVIVWVPKVMLHFPSQSKSLLYSSASIPIRKQGAKVALCKGHISHPKCDGNERVGILLTEHRDLICVMYHINIRRSFLNLQIHDLDKLDSSVKYI